MKVSKKTWSGQGRHSEKETRQGLSVVLKHQTLSSEERKKKSWQGSHVLAVC